MLEWSLFDATGDTVPDGAYRCRMISEDYLEEIDFTIEVAWAAPVAEATSCGLVLRSAPNPYSSGARFSSLRLRTPVAGAVTVEVLDVAGRRVRSLSPRILAANEEVSLGWDGRDDAGRLLPTGVYFVRAVQGEDVVIRKMALVR